MKRIKVAIPLFLLLVCSLTILSVKKRAQASRTISSINHKLPKLSELQMICDEISCPEYIAHIRIKNKRVCTGFLIDGNKIMTNHHCIVDVEKDCEGVEIYMNSSETNETMKFSCQNLVFAGDDQKNLNKLDYAVLELGEFSNNESIKFRGSKLDHLKNYDVFVTDWNKSNESLLIKKYECQPVVDEHIYKQEEFSNHSLLAFSNCPIIEGNSGSPIVDQDTGELVAILSRNFILDKEAYESSFQEINFDLVNNVGIAINAHCFFETNIYSLNEFRDKESCKDIDLSENNKNKILHDLSMKAFHQVNDYIEDIHITWLKSKSHGVFPFCLTDIERTKRILESDKKISYSINIPKFKTVMTVSPFFVKNIESVPKRDYDSYSIYIDDHVEEEETLVMKLKKKFSKNNHHDLWIMRDCKQEMDQSLVSSDLD